jgi:hypothetical protein
VSKLVAAFLKIFVAVAAKLAQRQNLALISGGVGFVADQKNNGQ